jgi:hypothetical protein
MKPLKSTSVAAKQTRLKCCPVVRSGFSKVLMVPAVTKMLALELIFVS